MEFLNQLIPKLISVILSWLDHGNLRNRVYEMKERIEILEVALDDVGRMSSDPKVKKVVQNALRDSQVIDSKGKK